MTSPQSIVYFIRQVGNIGPIKIGTSKAPLNRLRDLMLWSPVDLEILCTVSGNRSLEMRLHDHFAESHVRQEWFYPSTELVQLISDLREGGDVDTVIRLEQKHGSLWGRRRMKRSAA